MEKLLINFSVARSLLFYASLNGKLQLFYLTHLSLTAIATISLLMTILRVCGFIVIFD